MVDYLPDAHFVQVVLELFAAIQANDVALAVRLARLADRRNGACKAAVSTTEQEVQQSIDHLEPPGLGRAPQFPLWQKAGVWRGGMSGRCAAFTARCTRMRISLAVAAAPGVAVLYGRGLSPPTLGTSPALSPSHGETGIESLHYPRFAARAQCSSSRGVVSVRGYCLFHFASPARTTSRYRFRPSGRVNLRSPESA